MLGSLVRFRRWVLVLVLVLCGSGLTVSSGFSTGETGPRDATIAAIRAVLERQQADWNKGDLETFLNGYWHSPRLVFQSGGDRHDGWEAMRGRYLKRYKSEGRAMGQVAFSNIEIEPLGPESAFVRGAWRLTLPDGSRPGGLFTLIFRSFPDGWKIVHDHTSAEETQGKR
jgi:beta-aspartyl-peptidase (threonine type)